MTFATFLKIVSVIGSITGTIGAMNTIPGMSVGAGSTLIGISALVFKITDMIETKAKETVASQIQPITPPPSVPKTS